MTGKSGQRTSLWEYGKVGISTYAASEAAHFVSCGQSTEAERRLGRNICELIRELRPDVEPYFADNQSTVEGLSNNILKALYRAAGFVCLMHHRGNIETPDKRIVTRGSVWVEQEIEQAPTLPLSPPERPLAGRATLE